MIATVILLINLSIGIGMEIGRHGKEKKGKHNAWVTFLAALFILMLYYYAGIFNNF